MKVTTMTNIKFLSASLVALCLSAGLAMAQTTQLPVNNGGTGAYTAGGARYNLGFGGVYNPATGVNVGGFNGTPVTYAVLVAATPCNAANIGSLQPITDSTVITYNATISVGGGSYSVLAYCNGTNWTAH